jgi:magnesium transporter
MSDLEQLIDDKNMNELRAWLEDNDTLTIANEFARLEPNDRALAFRLLPKDRALDVFETLEPVHEQEIIEALREPYVRELLEEMEPDDRARLLDEVPATVAKKLLAGLSSRERRLTSILLGYPENSVGRIMSPKFVDIRNSMTVAEALAKVRRAGHDAETIYALPVTDNELRLVDVLDLSDLVLADPDMPVAAILFGDFYSVQASADQETAARLMQDASLIVLPVTDSEERLVGILTVDDAMFVLEEENTEDIVRSGGSQPLGQPYLSATAAGLARTRAVWLLILILAATMTVNILQMFQAALSHVIKLSLFIPLLINAGGNVGSQTATTIVRAMAVGEVRPEDWFLVLFRELRVGFMLGLLLGSVAFLPVMFFFGAPIAAVVALSLLIICTVASIFGATLPMLARRLNVDPAIVSAPVITTLVDATGLVVYFLIARAILHI